LLIDIAYDTILAPIRASLDRHVATFVISTTAGITRLDFVKRDVVIARRRHDDAAWHARRAPDRICPIVAIELCFGKDFQQLEEHQS
jgi:hypothetical protein